MTAVSLPREKLLTMSSKDLDYYIKDVARRRGPLSADEVKDVRWMKRLVKNRESAQASRNRKKNKIEELSAVVRELENEGKALSDTLTSLEASNKSLKDEVSSLVGIIRSSPTLANLWHSVHALRKRTMAKVPETSAFNNTQAAAMGLLFCLHAFNQNLTAARNAAAFVALPEQPAVTLSDCSRSLEVSDCSRRDELRSELQFIASLQQQQQQQAGGGGLENPVLLMVLPQSAAAMALRSQTLAQNALVFDLSAASMVPAVQS